jgi:hypothetical protein
MSDHSVSSVFQLVGARSSFYTSGELDGFDEVLADALSELRVRNNLPATQDGQAAVRQQLARAIFVAAAAGIREPGKLKRYAITSLIEPVAQHLPKP